MEIRINDEHLRAKKTFFRGMHRLCSPEETLENLREESQRIGLTRVADITGFDRIGVPVTATIRPNSLTLSASSGKGLTKNAAIVSGFMEAMELFHAECYPFKTITSTCEELKEIAPPLQELTLRKHAVLPPNWPYQWCMGWDLITQREMAVPLMAVSVDYRLAENDPYNLNSFEITSNGLASGNHPLEAIVSGIYEVIERDAITSMGKMAPKVRLDTIPYPSIQDLIEKLRHADISLALYESTVDTQVYVFKAEVYDQNVGYTGGYGAHLDPEVAILRAITEAIQSRAVFISGSRDDVFHSSFVPLRKFRTQEMLKELFSDEELRDVSQYKNEAKETFEEDIHILLKKLENAGMKHVIIFDLSLPESMFSVFRVVIPGLEGYKTRTLQLKKRAHHLADSPHVFHMPAGATS